MWKYRRYASDKGKLLWQVYWGKLKTLTKLQLGIPNPLVAETILDRTLVVRQGTIRRPPDLDDAWFLVLAQHSGTVFDIGANVGYTALLASFSPRLEAIVLVDANPNALAIAAENLIPNHLEAKARFLCAFVGGGRPSKYASGHTTRRQLAACVAASSSALGFQFHKCSYSDN